MSEFAREVVSSAAELDHEPYAVLALRAEGHGAAAMELLTVGYCGRSQGTILKSERSARDYRTTGRSGAVNGLLGSSQRHRRLPRVGAASTLQGEEVHVNPNVMPNEGDRATA